MKRREVLIGLGALPLLATAPNHFAAIEATLSGGRLGFAAARLSGGPILGHRAGERFALCSTFKMGLAAAVLARVDEGGVGLDDEIAVGADDVVPHAPVTGPAVGGTLSVERLLHAIVTVSDNAAANILLELLDSPSGLTRWWRSIGDRTSRLDRIETALNSNLPGDHRDTTTPAAMIGQMRALFGGRALSQASRDRLLGWMAESRTGLRRLRAGLPVGWVAGDKTGTGERGAANDVAIAWPPGGGAPILLAAYVDAADATPEARDAAHAAAAAIVVRMLA